MIGSTRGEVLDWTRGGGRAASPPTGEVDIILPVYGAARELERCLASVARHTDLSHHALTIVVDGPQDADVEAVLAAAPSARLLRNERRLGFVGAVNRGMRETTRTVVLLNSDTIVTRGWLSKMIDALESDPDAGTVTPLSNHSTLTSVPRGFAENLLPSGHDPDSFADVVERVSTRSYPRLPTAVGACMLIRRETLDEVGTFDEEHFGVGYGEENDFSFRALARGWLHVCDDATFIFHEGGRSFAADRLAAQKRAAARLNERHPAYLPTIAAFMKRDPLAPVRRRITQALARPRTTTSRGSAKVVHLVHGYPPFNAAGTEMYAWWLVERQKEQRDVSVYARIADTNRAFAEPLEWDDGGARIRLVTNNFLQRNPLSRNALHDRALARDFERFLLEERPALLHVHHLAGHAFSLPQIARRQQIPVVFQVQDWWQLCGRVNLQDAAGRRCSGPSIFKCSACAPLTRLPMSGILNPLLHGVRRAAAESALAQASAFVSGSDFIRSDYLRERIVPANVPWFVLPYGVAMPRRIDQPAPARHPLRLGIIGSLIPHKGAHVAVDAVRAFPPAQVELHSWGSDTHDVEYVAQLKRLAGDAAFRVHGPFAEKEKPAILDSIDVLLMPSVGLESFGLAAREAFARKVPVIATADGALLELFGDREAGALFRSGDAGELRALLAKLVEDPSIVERWRDAIPEVKSVDAHAVEIEDVYERVLAGARD